MATTTVSEAPWRTFQVDPEADYIADISQLLSSPGSLIKSYQVKKVLVDSRKVVVKHHYSYAEHLKSESTKQKLATYGQVIDNLCQDIQEERKDNKRRFQALEEECKADKEENKRKFQDLRKRLSALEVEHQAERDALLDWETKFRLAQGFNDYYLFFDPIKYIPKSDYKLLKAEGCGYLPYLLSMWAVFQGREPATRFNISREEEETYFGRAQGLLMKDLGGSVESVWNSLPPPDRSFMVVMFLSCPASRKVLVHVIPTIKEAVHIIDSDSDLQPAEKATAITFLPDLVDKCNKPLFNKLLR